MRVKGYDKKQGPDCKNSTSYVNIGCEDGILVL